MLTRAGACCIILAKDAYLNSASKQYTNFNSFNEFITYVDNAKVTPHFYEVLPTDSNHSVFITFDVDRQLYPDFDADIIADRDTYFNRLVEAFLERFSTFLLTVYKVNFQPVLGSNSHISQANSNAKLSFHAKFNIKCQNLKQVKAIAHNFIAFLASNQHTPEAKTRNLFFYKQQHKSSNEFACIIDKAIYTNFRCMRLLYSSKFKDKGVPLKPYKASSSNIADHLVLFYEHQSSTYSVFNELNTDIEQIAADYSKLKVIHGEIAHVPVVSPTQTCNGEVPEEVSNEVLSSVEEFLCTNEHIQNMLQTTQISFNYSNFLHPTIFAFNIDKRCNNYCPYAKRIHSNNRSYFEYHHKRSLVKYKCFNEDCKEVQKTKCIVIKLSRELDALKCVNNLTSFNTLHCQHKVIPWDLSYNSESMRPYPVKPIVCVRANMGVGKTVNLIPFMHENCSNSEVKCLFITYSRILSNKYAAAFNSIGFVNYLDKTDARMINDNKVIVCLDSLPRITTSNFHFIFIDEVLSVLMHFNSPYLKHDITCSLFELLLSQAQHLYLLDAHVDNLLSYNFVNYIAEKRHQPVYWIQNTHVRTSKPARKARIILNKSKKQETALRLKCIKHIATLLELGKRVVVASSTATFTKLLQKEIQELLNSQKNIVLYNSETDNAIKYQHSLNPNAVWNEVDLLIYSPTISAGVSFELHHFDMLVAMIDNSFNTPSIDLSLQQLFRVRNLSAKHYNMHIYVNDYINLDAIRYPIMPDDVTKWLDTKITEMEMYYPENSINFTSATSLKNGKIAYDKDRLSFNILHGLVYSTNKSLMHFTSILKKTLEDDYCIKTTVEEFRPDKDLFTEVIELKKRYKDAKINTLVPFSKQVLICDNQYEELEKKHKREENLTPLEKQQKWTYDMLAKWGVDSSKVDANFYDTYIRQCTPYERDKALSMYFAANRMKDALQFDVTTNQNRFKQKLAAIKEKEEFNMELYRTQVHEYYEQLIEGQELLAELLGDKYSQIIRSHAQIPIDNDASYNKLNAYVKNLSDECFVVVRKLFGLKPQNYKAVEDMYDNPRKLFIFANAILKDTFNICIENKGNEIKGKKIVKLKHVNNQMNCELINQYMSEIFRMRVKDSITEYQFTDIEDDIDLKV